MDPNVVSALRLMLVTDDSLLERGDPVELALAAERGGASSIQLRLKGVPARRQADVARALLVALRIPLLINDRPDVAVAAGAWGVHLGPADPPVSLIRRIAPPGFRIGASAGSEAELLTAAHADYWGVGPWRASPTKRDAGAPLGPAGFREIVRRAQGTPCLAIGGVRPEDVRQIVAAGGVGVAVASGILGAADVEAATRAYAEALAETIAR